MAQRNATRHAPHVSPSCPATHDATHSAANRSEPQNTAHDAPCQIRLSETTILSETTLQSETTNAANNARKNVMAKGNAHVQIARGIKDTEREVEGLMSQWDEMTARLADGFAKRFGDADAQVWLYKVVLRNVWKDVTEDGSDVKLFGNKIGNFYNWLATLRKVEYPKGFKATPRATSETAILSHFRREYQKGAELVNAGDEKKDVVKKDTVGKITSYVDKAPGLLAKVDVKTLTRDAADALSKGVNGLVDASNALLARAGMLPTRADMLASFNALIDAAYAPPQLPKTGTEG